MVIVRRVMHELSGAFIVQVWTGLRLRGLPEAPRSKAGDIASRA